MASVLGGVGNKKAPLFINCAPKSTSISQMARIGPVL